MSYNKTILITGAGGYVGGEIIRQALEKSDCFIKAATSSPDKLIEKFGKHEKLEIIDNNALFCDAMQDIDAVIHCAFSRRGCTNADIASSLTFSRDVFAAAVDNEVPLVINLSSQGVYGDMTGHRDEKTPASPTMPYTVAKYASEVILSSVCRTACATTYTSLRLDSIAGNQNITHSFIEQGMKNNKINIVGGKQLFSFIDVEDAADAILKVLELDVNVIKPVYNIGWNECRYTISELAQIAAKVVGKRMRKNVDVVLEERDIELYTGMNTQLFEKDSGWTPSLDMKQIFAKIYAEK